MLGFNEIACIGKIVIPGKITPNKIVTKSMSSSVTHLTVDSSSKIYSFFVRAVNGACQRRNNLETMNNMALLDLPEPSCLAIN